MDIFLIFLYFIIYSFIGWVLETIYCSVLQKKFVYRGFLYGPICPIYGFGALIVLLSLYQFRSYPLLVFVLGVLLTSTLEYITSYVLELVFNMKWWDYSKKKYNIAGRVCLLNSTLFGSLCLVLVYIVHPYISDNVEIFSDMAIQVTASILFVTILIDFALTLANLLKLKSRFASLETKLSAMIEKPQSLRDTTKAYMDSQKEFYSQAIESIFGFKPNFSTRRFLNSYPNLNSIKNPKSIQKMKEYLENRKK